MDYKPNLRKSARDLSDIITENQENVGHNRKISVIQENVGHNRKTLASTAKIPATACFSGPDFIKPMEEFI